MSNQVIFPLPSFAVPHYLNRPPTGKFEYDLIPIVTMAGCIPTLYLFAQRRRLVDFVLYGAGFLIACVYHVLQMKAHDGLASNVLLGIDGAAWRTIDILSANVLLARTMGHALQVEHPIIALLPNVFLPFSLVAMLALWPGVGLALAGRFTAAVVFLTMALQFLSGGRDMLRILRAKYSHPRMARALVNMALGIFTFVQPGLGRGDEYWCWHSLWHLFMAAGYYELYLGLLGDDHQTATPSGENTGDATQKQMQQTKDESRSGARRRSSRLSAAVLKKVSTGAAYLANDSEEDMTGGSSTTSAEAQDVFTMTSPKARHMSRARSRNSRRSD